MLIVALISIFGNSIMAHQEPPTLLEQIRNNEHVQNACFFSASLLMITTGNWALGCGFYVAFQYFFNGKEGVSQAGLDLVQAGLKDVIEAKVPETKNYHIADLAATSMRCGVEEMLGNRENIHYIAAEKAGSIIGQHTLTPISTRIMNTNDTSTANLNASLIGKNTAGILTAYAKNDEEKVKEYGIKVLLEPAFDASIYRGISKISDINIRRCCYEVYYKHPVIRHFISRHIPKGIITQLKNNTNIFIKEENHE